mmetsp:Transcript_34053/g.54638  ORF Transcript_34053/g.54638 Transcript_34053/m.54638 type:complete len:228 (-) Transcript_34053:1738-2421(-)
MPSWPKTTAASLTPRHALARPLTTRVLSPAPRANQSFLGASKSPASRLSARSVRGTSATGCRRRRWTHAGGCTRTTSCADHLPANDRYARSSGASEVELGAASLKRRIGEDGLQAGRYQVAASNSESGDGGGSKSTGNQPHNVVAAGDTVQTKDGSGSFPVFQGASPPPAPVEEVAVEGQRQAARVAAATAAGIEPWLTAGTIVAAASTPPSSWYFDSIRVRCCQLY